MFYSRAYGVDTIALYHINLHSIQSIVKSLNLEYFLFSIPTFLKTFT